MKRLFFTLLLGVGALWALPAHAEPADDWTRCSTSTDWLTRTTAPTISGNRPLCYEFDEGLDDTTGDTSFTVVEEKAWVCSVSNVNANGLGALRWTLYKCGTGFTTASLSVCEDVVATFSTDTCEAITRGQYFIDVTTPVSEDQDAVIRVQGYE
jgi:hypothetical protein